MSTVFAHMHARGYATVTTGFIAFVEFITLDVMFWVDW